LLYTFRFDLFFLQGDGFSLLYTFCAKSVAGKQRMGEKGGGIMEALTRLLCRKRLQETDSSSEWLLISALVHYYAYRKNQPAEI